MNNKPLNDQTGLDSLNTELLVIQIPTLSDIIWNVCFSFINCKDTTHLAASLSILVCLCENNFIFKKYLLSLLTEEDRKNLFVKCMQNQKLQVNNILKSPWATAPMNHSGKSEYQ